MRVRVATVADAAELMAFGRKAFDETFSGHPKNHPQDMALYMNEAFTVEQFHKELAMDGSVEGHEKNIFLVAEIEEGKDVATSSSGSPSKMDEDELATGSLVGKWVIAGYAKLTVGGKPEADVNIDINQSTGKPRVPIELCRLYVDQRFAGQKGLGTKIMVECYEVAAAHQCDLMWLGVWEYNYIAQKFYESKQGFRFVGKHVFQLGNDPQIDLIMQKEL